MLVWDHLYPYQVPLLFYASRHLPVLTELVLGLFAQKWGGDPPFAELDQQKVRARGRTLLGVPTRKVPPKTWPEIRAILQEESPELKSLPDEQLLVEICKRPSEGPWGIYFPSPPPHIDIRRFTELANLEPPITMHQGADRTCYPLPHPPVPGEFPKPLYESRTGDLPPDVNQLAFDLLSRWPVTYKSRNLGRTLSIEEGAKAGDLWNYMTWGYVREKRLMPDELAPTITDAYRVFTASVMLTRWWMLKVLDHEKNPVCPFPYVETDWWREPSEDRVPFLYLMRRKTEEIRREEKDDPEDDVPEALKPRERIIMTIDTVVSVGARSAAGLANLHRYCAKQGLHYTVI